MRTDIDAVVKYSWLALIAVVVIAVILIVYPSGETRSVCSGFQYFVFLSQKMTEDGYQIEMLNGPRDVLVKGWAINGINTAGGTEVKAGESFVLSSSVGPTSRKSGETFSYPLWIDYDMSGIKDNRDTATCTGKVQ